jgi:hypothetical protein
MAAITFEDHRVLFLPSTDVERRHALIIPGSNWAKARGAVTLPLNLLGWHQITEAFPIGRHDYSAEILQWRHQELEIAQHGKKVNDATLEVWDMPDLWDRQAQAIDRLLRYGSAGLFDDRGMGKTRIVVEAVRRSQPSTAVVVTGKRLRSTWLAATGLWWAEHQAYAPSAGTWSAAADQIGTTAITILTYESLLNQDVQDAIAKLDPDWLVVDEAHNVKKRQRKNKKDDGPDTQTKSGALRSMPGRNRVAITGTPMPNKWHELWALLNFIAPDTFGSYWHFVEALGTVSESYWGGREISPDVVRKDIWHELFDRWIISRHRPQQGKVWDFVPVELSPRERKAYAQMLVDWRSERDGHVLDAPNHLARLVRLQQLAGGLGEWETAEDETGRVVSSYRHADPSSKVDLLLEMLQGLDRAVVFTRFRDRAEYVTQRVLKEATQEPLLISGGTTEAATKVALERFSDPTQGPFVAVCVYGTISEGVNELVSASDIFFLDWTTVKDVTQAADRLDRPGQKRQVRCVTLYAKGTVDELAIDREAGKVVPLRNLLRDPEGWKFLEEMSR